MFGRHIARLEPLYPRQFQHHRDPRPRFTYRWENWRFTERRSCASARNKRCPKASIVGQCSDRTSNRYYTLGILTPNIDKLISVASEGARAIPCVDASLLLKQLFEVKITPNKAVLLWRSYGCEGKGAGLQTRSRRSPFLLLPVS